MAKRRRFPVLAGAVALLLFVGFIGSDPALSNDTCQEEVPQAQKPRETSPDVAKAELQALVQGNTKFALTLYQALRGQDGNLFLSPYSISLALAMAYAGARGETERQMAAVLQFALLQDRLHPAFNALDLAITSRTRPGLELSIANGFWGQVGYRFLQEYVDLLAEHYGAALRLLSFASTPEPCRVRINDWVSEKTQGKIKDLLPPGSITPLTRLVLTNAIYFKGTWRYQFEPRLTRDGIFYLLDGGRVIVPMMELCALRDGRYEEGASLNYTEGDGYQAVELPYVGEELAMVILLPKLEQFRNFERSLDAERLGAILGGLRPELVRLTMPKFSFTSGFSLKDTLSKLGMRDAFSDKEADFSGMDGTGDLFIDEVIHKAFIAVDEQGTEAAAATAVSITLGMRPEIKTVRVDRPFIFLIRDRKTGAILFMGRVLNPAG